jgi:uncharacterized protein
MTRRRDSSRRLLLYAYDSASPFHAASAAWWTDCLSGNEPIGLCPAVLFAFIRIGTSARAFAEPMTVQEAAGHIEQWFEEPATQILELDVEDIRQDQQFAIILSQGW